MTSTTTTAPVSRRRALITAAAAFAGGAAVAGPAIAGSVSAQVAPIFSDPVIPLIAEMHRLFDEADQLEEEADQLLDGMPDDTRYGAPSMVLPDIPAGYDHITYGERNLILALKRGDPSVAPMIELVEKPRHFYSEEHLRQELDCRGRRGEDAEQLVAEWRANKDRVDRAREEVGYTAALNQAKAVRARALELNKRTEKMPPPRTVAGVIPLIEMTDYEMDPVLVSALAGLRAMGGAA